MNQRDAHKGHLSRLLAEPECNVFMLSPRLSPDGALRFGKSCCVTVRAKSKWLIRLRRKLTSYWAKLAPANLAAVVQLLEVMVHVDEDEELTEEDVRAVAASLHASISATGRGSIVRAGCCRVRLCLHDPGPHCVSQKV